MDLFHNEIISFCLRKATIKLAAGLWIRIGINHDPVTDPAILLYLDP
jgi:hypothetical protein